MFKKTRKNKSSWLTFVFIVFLLIFIAGIYIFYKSFSLQKPLYISPLANQKELTLDKIEKALTNANISFSQVIASDSSYLVFLKSKEQIILPLKNDIEERISSLQLILKQFTIGGKKFKKIDFRFDKPTISF